MAKKERKNLKFWAEGLREELLTPHIEPYMDALALSWRAERDYRAKVCNEYHARISWRLADDEEPEALLDWDPLAPPVEEHLTEEEERAKWERIELLNAISGKYTRSQPSFDSPFMRLFAVMKVMQKPTRTLAPWQEFQTTENELLSPIYKRRYEEEKTKASAAGLPPPKNHGGFRGVVAREEFEKLTLDVKKEWAARAKASGETRKTAWKQLEKAGFPKDPHWRQRAIRDIEKFLLPILLKLYEMTGFHAVLLAGRNRAAVSQPFSATHPDALGDFTQAFKQYLNTCFSIDDRLKARATERDPDVITPEDILKAAQYTLDGSDSGSQSETSESDVFTDVETSKTQTKRGAMKTKKSTPSKPVGKRPRTASDSQSDAAPLPTPHQQSHRPKPKRRKAPRSNADESDNDEPMPAYDPADDSMDVNGAFQTSGAAAAARRRAEESAEKKAELAKKQAEAAENEKLAVEKKRLEAEERRRNAQEIERVRGIETNRREVAALVALANTEEAKAEARQKAEKEKLLLAEAAKRQQRVHDQVQERLQRQRSRLVSEPPSDAADMQDEDPIGPNRHNDTEDEDLLPPPLSRMHSPSSFGGDSRDEPPTTEEEDGPLPTTEEEDGGTPSTADDKPFTIARPLNCAGWLEKFLVEACRQDLGPLFRQLVEAVAELEEAYGYANDLGAKLTRKRTPPTVCDLGDVEGFRQMFLSWWSEMQPAWRERGDDGRYRRDPAAGRGWETMGSPGKDGMLLVVAALSWWGREEGKTHSVGWNTAAEDVLWVLHSLKDDATATLSALSAAAAEAEEAKGARGGKGGRARGRGGRRKVA
ncbi:hypothetical protein C8F01DRAFT_1263591 [Mycena amicta]|nr:hypothetical protein C8F01DRAFT_1263591 [Mycena amicta]